VTAHADDLARAIAGRPAWRENPASQARLGRPRCTARDCDRHAVEVDVRSGKTFCADHARRIRDVLHRRTAPFDCCARCGRWDVRDLELLRGMHLRRGTRTRPLCPACAELIEELIAGGSA
jgi:hypothetical protein